MEASLGLCLVLLQAGLCSLIKKSHLRLEKFEQCPDKLDIPITFQNTYISQVGFNKMRVFGDIIVKMDVVKPANIKCLLYKCPSRENQDLCEYYFTFKIDRFCEEIDSEKALWRTFLTQTSMPCQCPIKKGNYSLNGAQVNIADLLDMTLFNGYWKTKCSGKIKERFWFCTNVDFDLSPENSKGRRKSNKKGMSNFFVTKQLYMLRPMFFVYYEEDHWMAVENIREEK